MYWLCLLSAIIFEVVGTVALKLSNDFSNLIPTIIAIISYIISFYLFAISLKAIPLGVAYALWSCLGIIGVVLIGCFFFAQKIDFPAIIGITLIIIGVLVLKLISKSSMN